MRPDPSKRGAAIWWLASFLLLSLVFVSGILKTNALPALAGDYPTQVVNTRPHFDAVSEVVTMNLIDLTFLGLPNPKGFPFRVRHLGRPDPRVLDIERPHLYQPDWRPSAEELRDPDYYRSQIGLQGRAYALAASQLNLSRDQTYFVFRTFSAMALAAMLSVLIGFIFLLWGRGAAAAALTFCVFSTGFNLFAWSLYWAAFLHVAPTALMAALAMALPARSMVRPVLVFALFAILLMAKLASGYEFFTTTLAATAIPFFMVYAAGRISTKMLILYVGGALAIGVAAFIATVAIHNALYADAFDGSAIAWLSQRTDRWGSPSVTGPFDQLRDLAKILAINGVDIAGYGLPNALLVLAGVAFLVVAARALVTRQLDRERARIAILIGAAFLASASWPIIQFTHVTFHPRYSSFLISFPFGIFLAAGLARLWHLRGGQGVTGPDLGGS